MAASKPTSFATLSLQKSDHLRFLAFPDTITKGIEAVISQSWPPGIKAESVLQGSYTYQVNGRPWGSFGGADATGSRRLLRDVFAYLHSQNWVLVTALSHCVRVGSKDTLLFKHQPSPSPFSAPRASWLVISFTKSDRLRLDASGEHETAALIPLMRDVLVGLNFFLSGEWTNDSYEFRLREKPWQARGDKTVKVRMLVLGMVEMLDGQGWGSYGTVRQRTESDDEKKADSWYFVKEVKEVRPRGVSWGSKNPYNQDLVTLEGK